MSLAIFLKILGALKGINLSYRTSVQNDLIYLIYFPKASECNQEMPQSQATDQPTAIQGKTQNNNSHTTVKNTFKVKQPNLSSLASIVARKMYSTYRMLRIMGQALCVTRKLFSYFSTKRYVVGTQKNLNEMVLLSAQNIC